MRSGTAAFSIRIQQCQAEAWSLSRAGRACSSVDPLVATPLIRTLRDAVHSHTANPIPFGPKATWSTPIVTARCKRIWTGSIARHTILRTHACTPCRTSTATAYCAWCKMSTRKRLCFALDHLYRNDRAFCGLYVLLSPMHRRLGSSSVVQFAKDLKTKVSPYGFVFAFVSCTRSIRSRCPGRPL